MNGKNDQKYLRMTLNERVQHFLLLTSFFTLVITGFALKFPESVWVRWFIDLFGDSAFELRGTVHRIAAVVMVADSIYHVFYVSFTKRGRRLIRDFWFKKHDVADLKQSIRYYLGKEKKRPKFGRFSYIEKTEYWAMVWGTIVMSLTGSMLWFENMFLPIISNSGMNLATAIHYYEAILATLAIVVWHLYFVIYNPDVYPMNKAWFRGYLTREEMELEHPLELEEIEKSLKTAQEEKLTEEEEPVEAKPVEEKPVEAESKKEDEVIEVTPEEQPEEKKDSAEEIADNIIEQKPKKTGIAQTEKIGSNNVGKKEKTEEEKKKELPSAPPSKADREL
jgi:formate dehydrogenase gamma subunit